LYYSLDKYIADKTTSKTAETSGSGDIDYKNEEHVQEREPSSGSGSGSGSGSAGADISPSKFERRADEGHVYQKITMDISGGSKATTCMSEDKLKRSVVKYLRDLKDEKEELLFEKLTLNDVLIICDDSKRRRMLLASKVRLTISVQMPEADAANRVKKVADKMAEPAAKQALATNMRNEGVMLADDTRISLENVESIIAAKTTSKTAETSGSGAIGKAVTNYQNDPTVQATNKKMEDMGGDVKNEEEENDDIKVDVSISRTTLIYIIVGAVVLCCLCVIGIGVGLYFMGKANGNSNAPSQGKPQMTSNPSYEMRATPVVYATNQKPNQMAF
jgi:hypothetical protein